MTKMNSSKHGLSLLNSFQICRPKNPSSMIKTPASPAPSSKLFDISFPSFPDPPPTTPATITPPKSTPCTISPEKTRKKGSDRARRFKSYGSKEWKSDEKKVDESFVVEKRSVDPYEDFRKSMFEMIVEKQIFGPTELEELFMTFLELNSKLHHKVIVEAFTQVLNDVFCG